MDSIGRLVDTYKRFPITIEKGKGTTVWDNKGNEYIDCVAGVATVALGHSDEGFRKTLCEQLEKIVAPSNLFNLDIQDEFGEELCSAIGNGIEKVFFSNSGAEAIEAAMKFAVLKTNCSEFIAFDKAFHGRTLGSLSLTHNKKYREPFPLAARTWHVGYGNADAVEKTLKENGKKIAAIVVEPIQGEGGIIVPPDGFLKELRELADSHSKLLILDEIQTGMARTGKMFCFQHSGIKPDMVCCAKALANGVPIGATCVSEEVAKAVDYGKHGSTFGGNGLAMAAGLYTIRTIKKKKLWENAMELGELFKQKINHDHMPRGMGLLLGVPSKDPRKLCDKLIEKGVLSSVAGDATRFCPPLVMDRETWLKVIDRCNEALS